jgi:arylsulfatase A-like enzyme
MPEFGHSSAGQWRGAKRMLWEAGHRVPFLARWPGRTRAGTVENEVICLTDLMATIARLVDYRLPEEAGGDSYDIGAALFGRSRSRPIREATVHHSMMDEYALRQGDWVLIESNNGGGGAAEPAWWREKNGAPPNDQPGALYNLREDPREVKNLYAQNPERVRAMQALLERYKTQPRTAPRP